jgi:hypothetical protein
MKWYEPIECSNAVKNPFVANESNLEQEGYDEWDFRVGKLINKWENTVWIRATDNAHDGDPDDVLQHLLCLPIYSVRLRHALEEGGVRGIQYLPLKVYRPNDEEIKGFALINILNMVPGLDMEKSDYDVYPEDYFLSERRGHVRNIRRTVLKDDIVRGYDIIRLKEFKVAIYVSERFKEIFEKHRFTGYDFHQTGYAFWEDPPS